MQENIIHRKESCPFGAKAVELLDKKDIDYEDHIFSSKEEEESFKDRLDVSTTPQIFIDGHRIGGYEDLAEKFDVEAEVDETSYKPVIAVFSVALITTLFLGAGVMGFMGLSLILLATLKIMDLSAFKESFKKYDLISKNLPVYALIYPFAELFAGLGFLTGNFFYAAASISALVGIVGIISVYKAVYMDKRDLNCACVGGNSNVPLGAVSFSENAIMALMGLYVLTVF